jgi:serpin B
MKGEGSPAGRAAYTRLRKNSSSTVGITIRDAISQSMNRKSICILLLVSLVALGSLAAGCTDTPGTTSAGSAPPTAQETPGNQTVADDNVTAGNSRFAFDLYRQIANDPESAGQNIFFSPYSISSALAITGEGARGTTADEILSVLHLPGTTHSGEKGLPQSMPA